MQSKADLKPQRAPQGFHKKVDHNKVVISLLYLAMRRRTNPKTDSMSDTSGNATAAKLDDDSKEKKPQALPVWFEALGILWCVLTFVSMCFNGRTPFRHMIKHFCHGASSLCLYPLSLSKPWDKLQWSCYILVPTITMFSGVAHYNGVNLHKVEIFLVAAGTMGFMKGFKGKGERPWIIGYFWYLGFTATCLASLGMTQINCDDGDFFTWPWSAHCVGMIAMGLPYTAFWIVEFFDIQSGPMTWLSYSWPVTFLLWQMYGDVRDEPPPQECLDWWL